MRAAVLKEIGKPLVVEDVARPEPRADEVLIRTRACGVCRTDLHIQDGLAYIPALPHIPGHEPAGVIEAVGTEVTDFSPGDRVVPHLFVAERDCRYRRAGQHGQTTHLAGIIGVTRSGGFAEYFTAPAANLLRLPDDVGFDVGGLTSCAVITAVHASRKCQTVAGDAAAIVGAGGGIGLMLTQLLSSSGVRVVAIDMSSDGLSLASEAGADVAIDASAGNVGEQVRASIPDGVRTVVDLVGTTASIRQAADCVMRCGRIVILGEEAESPDLTTIEIAQNELEIVGSRNGGLQDAMDALDFMARGIIRPRIAARFPLDQVPEALELLRSGSVQGRIVIEVDAS